MSKAPGKPQPLSDDQLDKVAGGTGSVPGKGEAGLEDMMNSLSSYIDTDLARLQNILQNTTQAKDSVLDGIEKTSTTSAAKVIG